jgi:hypothetical protein
MSNVFVVTRTTDANGVQEYELMAAFSSFEGADKQAQVLKALYAVQVDELEVDVSVLVPQETVKVADGE